MNITELVYNFRLDRGLHTNLNLYSVRMHAGSLGSPVRGALARARRLAPGSTLLIEDLGKAHHFPF